VIGTTCKLCTFKIMQENVQVGCTLGKLEKFQANGATLSTFEEDGYIFQQFDRICLFLREKWEGGDIQDEVFIKATFVVAHRGGSLQELEQTLESVASVLSGVNTPPKVVVYSTISTLPEIYKAAAKHICKENLVCTKVLEEDYANAGDDEAFKSVKNSWVIFLNSGETVLKDSLVALNHYVNYDMKKALYLTNPDSYPAIIYKNLGGQFALPIREKLKGYAATDWKEIHENYRLYQEHH
jgi:hypothetical protein